MTRPTTRSTSSSSHDPDATNPPTVMVSSSTTDQRLDSILDILAHPDPRLVEILTGLEQRLGQRLTTTDDRLTTIEANYRGLSDTVRPLIESPPSPVISDPSLSQEIIENIIETKFNNTYQATLESFSRLSASVAELHLRQSNTPASSLSSPRHHGFFLQETKDFHVSRLIKLLDPEVLRSDSLQDLEIFFDSVLSHFNTVALTTDLYPRYRD
jgi:hypothetical protein